MRELLKWFVEEFLEELLERLLKEISERIPSAIYNREFLKLILEKLVRISV